MKGNYEPDKFTENDVLTCLERAGLKFKRGHRYILSQCPLPEHDDSSPSAQIYLDDFFVNCHVCGRYHITKAFPELRSQLGSKSSLNGVGRKENKAVSTGHRNGMTERKYIEVDLIDKWKEMDEIPADHRFKDIPIEDLTDMGWRWLPDIDSYFIPYFDKDKKCIPFAQYRHLKGDRRFTFLKDAKPIAYGLWNLDETKLFVCEGTSDAAVLQYCNIPWIALPSAASGEIMKAMARYCKEQNIELIYAGDNDEAGDKLKEALDEVMPYRVKQPPTKYKDWGDFFEAEGPAVVQEYCETELFDKELQASITPDVTATSDAETVKALMGGGEILEVVGATEKRKEQLMAPTPLF